MAGRVLTRFLYVTGVVLYYLAPGVVRWLGRNSPKVLLYHDCAEHETDYVAGLNSTTSPTRFAEHLDYLLAHYRPVDLSEITGGNAPPRAAAITFDDGYKSVFDNAYPELRRRALPATIYLISDVVDNHALVWVNELNHRLRQGVAARQLAAERLGLPAETRVEQIVDHCRVNFDRATIAALLEELRGADADQPGTAKAAGLYLSLAEIAEMAGNRIAFGNHTRTHPNLGRLSPEEQAQEIGDAQQSLSASIDLIPSLAFPFGNHDARTIGIAKNLDTMSVALVGGFNRRSRPDRIGRVHLANENLAGFFARVEVVEPVKGLLRDLARRLRPGHGEAQLG